MAKIVIDPVQLMIDKVRNVITGKKDRLDNDAAAAAELGLSYGKYKALQKEGLIPAQEEEAAKPAPAMIGTVTPRRVRVDYQPKPCEHCGEIFKPNQIRSKFCCDHCRNLAYAARQRAAARNRCTKRTEGEA